MMVETNHARNCDSGMQVPREMLSVWRRFDSFPMETLTKAWYYGQTPGPRQRPVELMEEHRQEHGTSGNCFDLTLWLLRDFAGAGIQAHAVGHDFGKEHAHVAVVAHDGLGREYLCDLGDQWVQPVLIDTTSSAFDPGPLTGFFPGARVQLARSGSNLEVTYLRSGGKSSRQTYDLAPVSMPDLLAGAETSQNLLRPPVCELRLFGLDQCCHWEFSRWISHVSSACGLSIEYSNLTIPEWSRVIHERTGISQDVVTRALSIYRGMDL